MSKLSHVESNGDAMQLISIFWEKAERPKNPTSWLTANAAFLAGATMTKGALSDELEFLSVLAYERFKLRNAEGLA